METEFASLLDVFVVSGEVVSGDQDLRNGVGVGRPYLTFTTRMNLQ